jgi:hypothetical protein
MDNTNEPYPNNTENHFPATTNSPNIKSLVILVLVIVFLGILSVIFNDPNNKSHWMEGPAIATMVIFMPLTAISYLHFRLPKKQDEFKIIKRSLQSENKDSELFSSLFNQEDTGADYLLPICFVSFFSAMGFYILFTNNALVLFNGMDWISGVTELFDDKGQEILDSKSYKRGVVAIGMAFLGAYIWAIQYIFRRMMTLDLPPGAFYSIGSRMVYSAFLAVILQHFLINSGSDDAYLDRQLIAISFMVGIFPERALSWMTDSLGKLFSRKSNSANTLPIEMLEGISSFHKARLSELGIDNVQNLAQASLMELILKTPFGPRVLIDWMAQARLCMEFKDKTEQLRGAGIRTIFDLQEIAEDKELLSAVAINSGLELSLIETVCLANKNEKSIDRLREAYDILQMI